MSDNLFAGAESLGDMPVFSDMGDSPDPLAPEPVLENPPPVEVPPAPAPKAADPAPTDPAPTDPEPVVPEQSEPSTPTEAPVKGKADFLDRLATKNRKIQERDTRIAALEAELAAARSSTPTPAAPAPTPAPSNTAAEDIAALRGQISQLREQYNTALMDGKTKDMAALDAQIEALRDQIVDKQVESRLATVEERVRNTVSQQQEATSVEAVVFELQAEYAVLDADSADYDDIAVTMVNARTSQLVQAGHTKAEALRTAAHEVMARYQGAKAPATTPPTKPVPAPRVVDAQKHLAAAAAQPAVPPAVVSTASQVNSIDIMKVPESEMAKWTEEDWARVRGDAVG